jgi:hypothetical protein
MMEALSSFYSLVYAAELVPSPDMWSQINSAVHTFLVNYAYLAHAAMQSGHCRYNIVYKHHLLAHVADAKSVGPRMFQTYLEESFIGHGCRLYARSVMGPYENVIQGKILRKYLLALQLRWSDMWH